MSTSEPQETGDGHDYPHPIETDYELGRDNISPFGLDIHNPVFLVSGLAIIAFVLITLMFQQGATEFFGWLRPALTSTFDWFFLGAANIFVLFCVLLMVTPLGKVRLGGADARPDYSYLGWFAMLFAAGMGIGLMFFGVSEPISHFSSSLGGTAVENGVRTDWAPLGAAVGDEARCQKSRYGGHHLSLGAPPLGDLCGAGTGAGLLHLQSRAAADLALGVLPDPGRADLGLVGAHHRYRCRVRHLVRPGDIAWIRYGTGAGRAQLPVRLGHRQCRQGDSDRRDYRPGADFGVARARRRGEDSLGDQHRPGSPCCCCS